MSAFLVSKRHIDAIVTGLMNAGLVPPTIEAADACGRLLWAENANSVAYRYREAPEDVTDYKWQRVALEPWALLKQLDCYDYQACEHPEWETSAAKALADALSRNILRAMNIEPASRFNDRRYEVAPWGVD